MLVQSRSLQCGVTMGVVFLLGHQFRGILDCVWFSVARNVVFIPWIEISCEVGTVCIKCVICIHWGVDGSCLELLKLLHYTTTLGSLPRNLNNILSLCFIPGTFWVLKMLTKMTYCKLCMPHSNLRSHRYHREVVMGRMPVRMENT